MYTNWLVRKGFSAMLLHELLIVLMPIAKQLNFHSFLHSQSTIIAHFFLDPNSKQFCA